MMTADLRALCRAYATHVGLAEPSEGFAAEIDRRLSRWPAWARLGAASSATAVRWLSPLFLLARPRRFDSLSGDEKEALLARLQRTRTPAARATFLLVKTIVLGTCYGELSS